MPQPSEHLRLSRLPDGDLLEPASVSVGLTSTPVNTIMVLSHGTLPYSYRETLDETHRVSFDHRYLRRHNSSVCRNRTFAQILPELFWLTEQWGGIVQKSRTQCTSRPEAAARGRGRESQQNTWAKRTAPTSTRVVCEETGEKSCKRRARCQARVSMPLVAGRGTSQAERERPTAPIPGTRMTSD